MNQIVLKIVCVTAVLAILPFYLLTFRTIAKKIGDIFAHCIDVWISAWVELFNEELSESEKEGCNETEENH